MGGPGRGKCLRGPGERLRFEVEDGKGWGGGEWEESGERGAKV